MHKTATKYRLFFLLLWCLWLFACEKEYSYEGGLPSIVIVPVDSTDSVGPDPGEFPSCAMCHLATSIQAAPWSFKIGNSLMCGEVDTAIILSLTRNTFTFFGPATCGADTGIIFTVNLDIALDRDLVNVEATNAVFYYYHTFSPFILISRADQPFKLTISSYNHATKIIEGTFSGIGYKGDATSVSVTDGKFRFRLI
jgi:hypothetical protein